MGGFNSGFSPGFGVQMKSVRLGTQVWTTQNYRGTKLANNDDIPLVTGDAAWAALTTPGRCYYGNSETAAFQEKYGMLYNWHAMSAGLQVPQGWSVATDAAYTTLADWLIANGYNWDESTSGNKIGKALAATAGWTVRTVEGAVGNGQETNNSSGFNAECTGFRSEAGVFSSPTNYTLLWTNVNAASTTGWLRILFSNSVEFARSSYDKKAGGSVRLFRALLTPTITSIKRSGSTVTVTGTNFKPDEYAGNPAVTEGGVAVTPTSISNTQVVYETAAAPDVVLKIRVMNNPDGLYAEKGFYQKKQIGRTWRLEWEDFLSDTVTISYVADGGSRVTITETAPNDPDGAYYDWTVDAPESAELIVRVADNDETDYYIDFPAVEIAEYVARSMTQASRYFRLLPC